MTKAAKFRLTRKHIASLYLNTDLRNYRPLWQGPVLDLVVGPPILNLIRIHSDGSFDGPQ